MTKLKQLIEAARRANEEILNLDAMERDAKSLVEEATAEDIQSASTQQKIARARTILDLVGLRRKKLKGQPEEFVRLKAECLAVGKAWNERVQAALLVLRHRIAEANAPFYGKNDRAIRDFLKRELPSMPAVRKLERAQFFAPQSAQPNDIDWIATSSALLALMKREEKSLQS